MPIDFGNFPDSKNASIQFSFPAVNNVIYDKATHSFFLPNNSVTPNFSYTDAKNNLYISGASIRGYIRKNDLASLTKSSRELVLEHQLANSNTKFYVVIPLETNNTSKTTLSKLNDKSSIVLDLNSDISNQNTIYHYMSGDVRVFVFGTPITVKPDFFAGGNVPSGLPTTGITQQFKIKSPTKVEDEIVCGYTEDAPAKPVNDTTTTTVVVSFGSLLLNIVLLVIFLYLFKNYGDKFLSDYKLHVLGVLFVVWCVIAGIFVWFAIKKKTNYMIIIGSLLFTATFMFSVIFSPDFAKVVKAATPAATPAAAAPIPRGLFSASSIITGRHP